MLLMLVLLTLLSPLGLAAQSHLEVAYSWTFPEIKFRSEAMRQEYLDSNRYIPANNILTDVDVWKGDGRQTVFVTLAKFNPGQPVTLAIVTNETRNGVNLLQPYPDWSSQGNCDGLYSVYRMKVDNCNRLWVVDSGVYLDANIVCPPKIVVFDLLTNNTIRRHRFPSSILSCNSNLITIVVDTSGGCDKGVAYIADVTGFKLLVYDYSRNESWQVTNNNFFPDPNYGHFTISGTSLNFLDGLFGLALGPVCNKDRRLYFHSLASVRESWVMTSVVSNKTLFANDSGALPQAFHTSNGTRQSQSSTEDMTDSGVLFYGLVAENAIGCWNSDLPFTRLTVDIVAKDDKRLQFPTGVKVIGDQLWVISNKLQNVVNGGVHKNETNYYILFGNVNDLTWNTRCHSRRPRGPCKPLIARPFDLLLKTLG